MPTFKLTLEYDGTGYAGWQRQPNQPTIQEAVEHAILQVSQATVSVIAAGRTDAGVHALGQVASFFIVFLIGFILMMGIGSGLRRD